VRVQLRGKREQRPWALTRSGTTVYLGDTSNGTATKDSDGVEWQLTRIRGPRSLELVGVLELFASVDRVATDRDYPGGMDAVSD
jgi:hypothetical protein